eukprot:42545-Chlamydomonas_euryale.AAC.1
MAAWPQLRAQMHADDGCMAAAACKGIQSWMEWLQRHPEPKALSPVRTFSRRFHTRLPNVS